MLKFTLPLTAVFIGLCAVASLQAAEPNYCDPKVFLSLEKPLPGALLFRAHMFQIGKVNLVGVSLGFTATDEVIRLSDQNLPLNASHNTWYFSDERPSATESFHPFPLPSPKDGEFNPSDRETLVSAFESVFHKMTTPDEAGNIFSSVEESHFIAMGCDSQRHRGPTVVGMLLAFAGCTPAHALEIVNTVWGLNGVPEDLRLEIIQKASAMGDANEAARERLQAAFSGDLPRGPSLISPSPQADADYFKKAIGDLFNQKILKNHPGEEAGLRLYWTFSEDPRKARKPSFSELRDKIKSGLAYEDAVKSSFEYWNKVMKDGDQKDHSEKNAQKVTDAYFRERLEIANRFLAPKP